MDRPVPDDLLSEFTVKFEQGLQAWEQVMQTGDTGPIEADLAEHAVCYFGRAGSDQLDLIDREGIVTGMREAVGALQGGRKRFENRLIRMRGADEAVVFFEQVIEMNGQDLARLFTIETYRRIDGRWQCIREVAEHLGA